MACRRLAPADTVSGIGIERVVSVGAGEDGSGGNAVNVKGESGESGNGWMCGADVGVAVTAGFSLAWRGEVEARACALSPRVGYGGAVVAVGGVGGVEGRAFGAAVIVCDNFDGGRGPYVRQTIVSFRGNEGEGEVTKGREERSSLVVPSVIVAAVAQPGRYSLVRGCSL